MNTKPSFQQVYDRHAEMVFNLSLNYLQNVQDAEEITQDVFCKIHQKYEQFRAESTLKTWIYRITINQCLDFIKAKKRKKRLFHITSLLSNNKAIKSTVSNFEHPGVILEYKEFTEQLFSHINSLPETQKTVLLLKTIEKLSQKEIAVIMKLSVKAVESLLSRARKNLRKKLK